MNNQDKKTIILFNSIPYFLRFFNRKNVIGDKVLRDLSFLEKVLRKISQKLKLPQYYWFSGWKNHLKEADTVIIFATLKELDVLKLIRKVNPKVRIIYWYWNPISGIKKIDKKYLEGLEIWSFDPKDCLDNKFKFNTTFYFNNLELPENEVLYDVIFVGKDKGRKEKLELLRVELEKRGLNPYYYILSDDPKDLVNKIPYEKYLQKVSKSKALIDFIPEGQSGLTVRAMESIFLKKKLITFDQTIVKQDFYTIDNIFIVGKDNVDDLKQFIDTPYKELDEKIVGNYDLEEWLKRFN